MFYFELIETFYIHVGKKFKKSDTYFVAFSFQEGALLWRMNIDDSSIYASVAIYETYAIAATLRGTVVTIDMNDNNVKCRYQFGRPVFSNPLPLQDLNAFCVADVSGVLYCCCVTIEMVVSF